MEPLTRGEALAGLIPAGYRLAKVYPRKPGSKRYVRKTPLTQRQKDNARAAARARNLRIKIAASRGGYVFNKSRALNVGTRSFRGGSSLPAQLAGDIMLAQGVPYRAGLVRARDAI